jgi:hypothetical protein
MEQTKLKVMVREVNQLAWRYKQAQVQVKMYQPHVDCQQKQLYENNLIFIEAFQYILDHMAEENRQIIVNDFINQHQHQWWINFYARSTYYRIKGKALRELLSFLR